MMNKPIILITSGEPGGIGIDICLDLPLVDDCRLIVLGDINLLANRAKLLNKQIKLYQISLDNIHNNDFISVPFDVVLVLHVECPELDIVGKLNIKNAKYVLELLDIASSLCESKIVNAMVTAPVNKEIINKAGYNFSGHTEYLANRFGCHKVVMMLANSVMKVALLTTHLPLSEVPRQVTRENLQETLQIIITVFNQHYKIANPKIAICGLNPHAGEGGYLGSEELMIIDPLIKEWQDNGYNISGSYPADTIFNRAGDFDLILAMYHDQGLPVLKYADFAGGVNITLGLPIIRISVDHGTALSLAGSGRANAQSLHQAIFEARRIINNGEKV